MRGGNAIGGAAGANGIGGCQEDGDRRLKAAANAELVRVVGMGRVVEVCCVLFW